jgi:sensor histidine kinase YesM
MEVFFDTRKTSSKLQFLTYVIYYLIGTALFIFLDIPVVLMIYNLTSLFALTYNYESTVKNRVLSTLFIYSVLVIVEVLVGVLDGYLEAFSHFSTNIHSSVFGVIACRIVSYAFVLALNNFKHIKRGELVPTSNWISIALIPVSSLYVILLLFQAREISAVLIMIGVILMLLINFATFYLYDVITATISDKMQSLLALEQNKYYNNQLEMIKSSLQATSAIRHDLKNHMFSIRSLIESGDTKETMNYISEIMDDIGTKKDSSATGNTVIDSIINFKILEAEQRGIRTNLELRIPEKLEIPSFDMTVILGNLLDNAIKAVGKVNEDRFINLKIKYDKGRLMIQADNPYTGKINEEDGRIITTHVDRENHGIGLESIKKVVQKYDGIMNIDHSENIFSVSLLMYVD